ncbi:MAG: pseudouridine-5'-phosphate glycosidase [Deltaproteobacteria bacterium]|nr:pseudouridine-5'-phosphate glycosidase [Deltaproteobacteria bacterium]
MSEVQPLLRLTEEVEDAIAERRPLVALESTLLAHGLPAERRATVAAELEAVVRAEGAVPATIAVVDGRFCVGLEGELLARVIAGGAEKASIRDLAVAVATGGVWATTVASTMAVAHRAGIRVFATGGIGGVHRGAEHTFDESADLMALARYPVTVVCAGAKSVLDLPRTLERLETLGVPVLGYGTAELPAFYHGRSGLPVSYRVDDPATVARIMAVQYEQLAGGGLLVCQPPPEAEAQDPAVVDALIQGALAAAEAAGVKGRAVTPFLLGALDQASGGDVVRTNVALVAHNTRLAARIAVADQRPRDE